MSGDSIRYGKRAPKFAPVPEWVLLAGISPDAVALYAVLLAHVNHGLENGVAFPGMETLAGILGFKQRKSVSRYLRELVGIKAVEVERKKHSTFRRNEYVVNELPPDDHTGPRSLLEFYDRRKTAGQAPTGTQVPLGTGMEVPSNERKGTIGRSKDSPTARPHSAERGRQRSAKPQDQRTTRRADYPTDDAWISDDLDEMVCNIVAHVEELFGEIPGLDPLLQSKITPKLDPDTYEELPFTPPDPRHLMNTALKAGRWRTVNFRWIDEQIAAGRNPGDELAPDPWAAA